MQMAKTSFKCFSFSVSAISSVLSSCSIVIQISLSYQSIGIKINIGSSVVMKPVRIYFTKQKAVHVPAGISLKMPAQSSTLPFVLTIAPEAKVRRRITSGTVSDIRRKKRYILSLAGFKDNACFSIKRSYALIDIVHRIRCHISMID